jgi:DNA polymerase (family 10)
MQTVTRGTPPIIARMAEALPRNEDVAAQFELLADILEIEGYDAFRVLAYRRAAALIRDTAGSIAQLALDGKAKQLQGIGKTIEGKIVEIVDDGEVHALTKHKGIVPPDVVAFTRLPGLGPKTARRIWQDLSVTTLPELRKAAEEQRLRTLSGLGAKIEETVLKALDEKTSAPPETGRALLGVALPAVLEAVETLREHPAAVKVSEAGSARRRRETVRDLDIIATATDPEALIAHFVELPWVVEVVARGGTKATVLSSQGLRFDLRVVPPECYGNLLQHFTGSKHHNVALREEAVRRGFSVSEYGVKVVETGEVLTHAEEADLYELLGYAFIPPELRENLGELEAAREGTLPELVELRDLRGDLHAHTTWSADGKATAEEMALAAKARGYRYLAVTDHSHYLREGRMEAQDAELDALNEKLAPFQLLKGVEANIKADGTIDVPDDVLATREWVIASLHTSFDKNPTERVLGAMEHPHVHCIGHLLARKIGRRAGAALDVERVVEKAVETGTCLEIDSQPDRLDMPDFVARLAGEAGVQIAVTSDAHRLSALGYVEFGIGQARRAWLTKQQILNTRTWPQVAKARK